MGNLHFTLVYSLNHDSKQCSKFLENGRFMKVNHLDHNGNLLANKYNKRSMKTIKTYLKLTICFIVLKRNCEWKEDYLALR